MSDTDGVKLLDLRLVRFYTANSSPAAGDEAVLGWYSVYLYDRNEVTHCCELTPSYCCYWLYDYPKFDDVVLPDLSEVEIERLNDAYGQPPDQYICYVHCSDVERLGGKAQDGYVVGEQPLPEDVTYEDAIEAYLEHYRSNWKL